MLPLDPFARSSSIARLLRGAPAHDVRAELDRLTDPAADDASRAALLFAEGALALREGALDAAHASLTEAADAFERAGERQASLLARCEAILAAVRRGPRAVFEGSIALLSAIARDSGDDARVRAVATHYAGTATRMSGDAIATQRMLLAALTASEGILDERAKILNSLGTLYVVLGAFGAAQAMLEHAAELHHQNGDAVGEAIAYGQLGAASIGLGDLERARRCLQKQEWLSSRVGDTFGRARALTFLADVALELGRPDDAVLFAASARDIASGTSPPLRLWIAYASRAIGRAKTDLGDPGAGPELFAARDLFATIGNPLGSALTEWDIARLQAKGVPVAAPPPFSPSDGESPALNLALDPALDPARPASWSRAAWALGSLGLASRVAQLLRDHRTAYGDAGSPATASSAALPGAPAGTLPGTPPRASEMALAAIAQVVPHLAAMHEVELIYEAPEALSAIAERRTAAQRNLARLAALTIAEPGLFVATAASRSIGARGRALPPERTAAALAGELPGLAIWVWSVATPLADVARDLAWMRRSLGEDVRAVLSVAPFARVAAPPFAGEAGAELEAVEIHDAIVIVRALERGALHIGASIDWSPEAEAIASGAGYMTQLG